MNQYEIWLADLNPKIGTEAGKIRPVIIVQTNLINKIHPSTIICPITTQIQPEAKLLRIHLLPDKGNGLQKKSDIMIDQLRAIDNKRFVKRIGVLNAITIHGLKECLRIVMDL